MHYYATKRTKLPSCWIIYCVLSFKETISSSMPHRSKNSSEGVKLKDNLVETKITFQYHPDQQFISAFVEANANSLFVPFFDNEYERIKSS